MATSDETMLRALYAEHAGPLLGFALRLTGGDRGRAEDIVQETLLRAWRHPEAVDPGRGAIRPWLFTVARHLSVDAHRARQTRPAEVDFELARSVSGADDIDRAMQGWLVGDALATLSPEHRAVLVETYYRGQSVAEAARTLGVPAGTVKSRSYYALRALRLALDERGVTP
ncbi:MAG TPA: sigma-70 family RNA polymerase sigma factor [Mycobacteriales bacterium]|nr:sigma-70 family RNA polymerase sigma factor [Mycobacteriales bacterium]